MDARDEAMKAKEARDKARAEHKKSRAASQRESRLFNVALQCFVDLTDFDIPYFEEHIQDMAPDKDGARGLARSAKVAILIANIFVTEFDKITKKGE